MLKWYLALNILKSSYFIVLVVFMLLFCFVLSFLCSYFARNLTIKHVTGFVPRLWQNDVMKDLLGWYAILSNCEREAWKKFRLQRDSNPWPLRYRCSALPTELWSHNCWEQVNFSGSIMPLRVIQHYSDWVCTAVMSNDVMKDLRP